MHRLTVHLLLVFAALPAASQTLPADHAERMKAGTALFQKTIRPALVSSCLKCHGDEKIRAGLDLSSRELLLKGGESGLAIDLASPGDSFLLGLLRHEEEPAMPPKQDKLAADLIADFERWISLGAPYDKPLLEKAGAAPVEMQITESDREFWSYQPLAGEPAGQVDIDHFIQAKLKEKKLTPNPPADAHAKVRRAYLDLIGLPPTVEQLKAGLAMSHKDLVDKLLESPHYGERWARHWLDAARFAESHGFEQDYDRQFAYHYRDFVIKALNANMPWDQFIKWQLAGDEIAPEDPLAMMATGFLGAGVFPTQLTEKEFESARYDELDDMAATTGTAMLGLTIGCARCHDHKFDPIPVKDYYQFLSLFTTTIRSEIDLDLDPVNYQNQLQKWKPAHDKVIAELSEYEARPDVIAAFDNWLATSAKTAIKSDAWVVSEILEATSSEKATQLTVSADGFVLASGKAPAREVYTVKTAPIPPFNRVKSSTQQGTMEAFRFLRIEALTHETMPQKGPGRAGNGNFALSHLEVFATQGAERKPVKLTSAKATHEQNKGGLSVASAIDGDPKGTGWAVDSGGIGKDQAAVFEMSGVVPGAALEIKLTFGNNAQHSLGHFRVSFSSENDPPVVVGGGTSARMQAALAALETGSLLPEHRKLLFSIFAKTDPEWLKRNQAVQTSLNQKPTPQTEKVQVSSEGFPPTKHHADGRGFPHFYPKTHHLNRGDVNQKKEVAESGFLRVLMRNGKTTGDWVKNPPPTWSRTSYRRLSLANWISDVENGAGHLLARVAVNRIWYHHFGRGIVATPNDFGLQGTLPSHPELLDFLARRFIASGWDVKQLHRDILLSETWQQSSSAAPEKVMIDPENQWFWRFTPRRLEAENIRDSILAVSGQLDSKLFGPGTLDLSQRRRSIYFKVKRSQLVPMMQIFDQPEPLASQGGRPSTTIAPQALFFMNNNQVVDWARSLATKVNTADEETAIREIYLRTLGREPDSAEMSETRAFLAAQSATYSHQPSTPNHQLSTDNSRQLALADLCQVIFSLNEFVYLP